MAIPDASTIEVANLAAQSTNAPEVKPAETKPAVMSPSSEKPNDFDLAFLNADEPGTQPEAKPGEEAPKTSPEPKAEVKPESLPKYIQDLAAEVGLETGAMSAEQVVQAVNQRVKEVKQPAKPSHPQALVNAALTLGLRSSHINGMSTDDLTDLVFSLRQPQTQAAQTTQPVDEDEAVLQYLEKEVGADPKLLAMLKRQHKKISDLEGNLKQQGEREAQRRQVSGEEAIDTAFEQLGVKFEKVFGKGAFRSMSEGPQRQTRLRVFQSAGIDVQNDTEPVIRRKIQAAVGDLYRDVLGDNAYETAKPQAAPPATNGAAPKGKHTTEEWDGGGTARPTSSDPQLTKREKTLLGAVKDYYREHGITNRDESANLDGIPD